MSPESGAGHSNAVGSTKLVQTLHALDSRIHSLLLHSAQALAALHPEEGASALGEASSMLSTVTEQAPSEMDEDEQADDDENAVLERQKRLFDRHAKAYFLALNDVQLTLRRSIASLRASRALSAPLVPRALSEGSKNGGDGTAAAYAAFLRARDQRVARFPLDPLPLRSAPAPTVESLKEELEKVEAEIEKRKEQSENGPGGATSDDEGKTADKA